MKKLFGTLLVLLLVFPLLAEEETKYTNDSVARLSHLTGNTFIQRASDIGFEECVLNTPITEGDRLGTTDGRAEVHFGQGNYIRLDNETKIDMLSLPKKGNDSVRIRVWAGHVYLDIANLVKEKNIEIHTADTSFYVLDEGLYRVDVKENKDTEVLVFRGLIEAAGEEGSILIKAGQRLEAVEGRFGSRPSQFVAAASDTFDRWNDTRNTEVSKRLAKKYLPNEMEDFEYELGQYGDWMNMPPYGNVWVPGGIDAGWRPYSNGRWTWLPLTGWTWLPYEPWGWATFHYGRWHWGMDFGWYWIPTSMWGPAWVDWWWDNDYFAWAPLSYWGYPVVIVDGMFYGHHYGDYYPYNSHALTVVHRDQLRAKNLSEVALRGDSLKGLSRMSLSNRSLEVRPLSGRTLVQPIEGRKVLLRTGEKSLGTIQGDDRGGEIRTLNPQNLGKGKGEAKGEPKSAAPAKGATEKKIRKKDESSSNRFGSPWDGAGSIPGLNGESEGLITKRSVYGYPASPTIHSGKSVRDYDYGHTERSSFLSRIIRSFSGEDYSPRNSSSSSSSSGSRISSKSGSGSSSRGSSSSGSRSSISSRGSSSSGSHSSGSIRKKN